MTGTSQAGTQILEGPLLGMTTASGFYKQAKTAPPWSLPGARGNKQGPRLRESLGGGAGSGGAEGGADAAPWCCSRATVLCFGQRKKDYTQLGVVPAKRLIAIFEYLPFFS